MDHNLKNDDFSYNYIEVFLAVKAIKTKTPQMVVATGVLLMLVCFISLFYAKKSYRINYPNLRGIKKIGKTLLFPIKILIFTYLIYLAYGGKVSILSMVYRTAFVVILIQSLKQASSEKKKKIQVTGYIRFMHKLTLFFLMFFALVVVFLRILTNHKQKSEMFSRDVNSFFENIRDNYSEKIANCLIQVSLIA